GADEAGAAAAVAAMADEDATAAEEAALSAELAAAAAEESAAAAEESAAGAAFFLQAARPRAATALSASARVTDVFMEILLRETLRRSVGRRADIRQRLASYHFRRLDQVFESTS